MGIKYYKAVIFKALTEKAELLLPLMIKSGNRQIETEVIDKDKVKFIIKSKIMMAHITIDTFHIIFKKFGLEKTDYEVTECC